GLGLPRETRFWFRGNPADSFFFRFLDGEPAESRGPGSIRGEQLTEPPKSGVSAHSGNDPFREKT
ncbi:MAG: hypothetical protein WA634_10300, partial [Silvibacterium sp.]